MYIVHTIGCCVLSTFLLQLAASVVCAQEPKREPLPLAESLQFFRLGNRVRISPDGHHVAFTTRDLSRARLFAGTYSNTYLDGQDIWVAKMTGGEPVRLSGGSSWSPIWSPDGRTLAFISDRDGGNHLWTWDRTTGESRRVSPVLIRQVGDATAFPQWSYLHWTPDGREVLARVVPEGMTESDAEAFAHEPSGGAARRRSLGESAVTELYSAAAETTASPKDDLVLNWRQKVWFGDLALINVKTGAVRRLARRVMAARYDVSPDGTAVAYLNGKGMRDTEAARVYDLVVVNVGTGASRTLVRDVRQGVLGMHFKWSPDSQQIAYVSGPWDGPALRIVSLAGGQDVDLLPLPGSSHYSDQVLPVWDASREWLYVAGPRDVWRVKVTGGDRETVLTVAETERVKQILVERSGQGEHLWSGDDQSLAVEIETETETGRTRTFARVSLQARQRTNLPAAANEPDDSVAVQKSRLLGQPVVYASEGATRVRDLWIATPDGKRRRLSRTNPLYEAYELGQPRLIDWRNSDGITRRGALMLPAGYEMGRRYPLIVWVYGSDLLSESIGTFGFGAPLVNAHIFATRGYAVLFPDSTVRVGTPMADIAGNVLPGVDRVIELGIADPERVGVIGHSYGGYSTLALITQTQRFKAAVSYSGLTNLLSAYGLLDENGAADTATLAEQGSLSMGGSPWTYRERYIENSPQVFLDRIRTPVLVVVGDQDRLRTQSDELFVGLRRLGKTATYAKYSRVGHTITYYPALVDHWQRLVGWFDRYLRSAEAPRPSAQ